MLRKTPLIFIFCLFMTVLPAVTALTYAEDKIVAIVNREIITQKDLDDFMNFMYLQLSAKYQGKELEDKMNGVKPDLLNRLIEDKLILEEAKKENIQVDEARVKAKISEIKSNYPSEAEFQDALVKQGLTQADIEKRIREQLLIFEIIDLQIRKKIIVSPKEVTDFYEEHKEEFVQPETRRVNSLITKNEVLANKVISSLGQGADLDKISKEYSLELNDLGAVKKGQLVKEIEDVIFNMDAGSISQAIKVGDAYYIFKLQEILPLKKYNLVEVQEEIYYRLYELKMQEGLTRWLEDLRKKAYVEIKKG
ncbi:MAG: SurA N-terminal domain-containing protein [Candidatus Omnitrophota bacterium]|nr:SurA N-terminal domain-containing protein [Candidatus Omnitrophota bacterium]